MAIRDEEREAGGEKEAIMSAMCFSSTVDRSLPGRPRRGVFSPPPMRRRALRKAYFSCFSSFSSSSVSARIFLSVATMLFAYFRK